MPVCGRWLLSSRQQQHLDFSFSFLLPKKKKDRHSLGESLAIQHFSIVCLSHSLLSCPLPWQYVLISWQTWRSYWCLPLPNFPTSSWVKSVFEGAFPLVFAEWSRMSVLVEQAANTLGTLLLQASPLNSERCVFSGTSFQYWRDLSVATLLLTLQFVNEFCIVLNYLLKSVLLIT